MLQVRAKVLSNKRVKGDYFHLAFSAAGIARQAQAGQFVNIKVSDDAYEPLLRRPFSIHKVKGADVELLYEVVGKATEILAKKKSGEYLDIIGPLGKGFGCTLHAARCTLPILVAGGMGVAPLVFLAEKIMEKRQAAGDNKRPFVLLGAKTKDQIICEKEFRDLGCGVKISTDDGSSGFKGRVTELLKEILRRTKDEGRRTRIYSCGPKPMLKEISRISDKYNMLAQISLEEHMACGIGACLGCVVKTTEGYRRVCKEGPVFNAQEIIW